MRTIRDEDDGDAHDLVKPTDEERERVLKLLQEGRAVRKEFRRRVEPMLRVDERQRHLRLNGELLASVDPQDCETARDMERVIVHSQEAFEAAARVVARSREVAHAGQGDRGSGMPDSGPIGHDVPAGQEGSEALGEGSEEAMVAEPDAAREAAASEGMERAE